MITQLSIHQSEDIPPTEVEQVVPIDPEAWAREQIEAVPLDWHIMKRQQRFREINRQLLTYKKAS